MAGIDMILLALPGDRVVAVRFGCNQPVERVDIEACPCDRIPQMLAFIPSIDGAVPDDARDLVQEGEPLARLGCRDRSEEHTSELQSLMRTSYAVFCLKKKRHK